jgi:hypothetical protein
VTTTTTTTGATTMTTTATRVYAEPSHTDVVCTRIARADAVSRATRFLEPYGDQELGQVFPIRFWTGLEHVPAWLRYTVQPTANGDAWNVVVDRWLVDPTVPTGSTLEAKARTWTDDLALIAGVDPANLENGDRGADLDRFLAAAIRLAMEGLDGGPESDAWGEMDAIATQIEAGR